MKTKLTLISIVVCVVCLLPGVAHADYQVNQITQLPGQILNVSNQAQNTLTQYTGLRLSDILKATGNDSANQKLCQAQNVLGALDNIIGNFKNFITDEVNVFMQAFMANVAKSLIYCTLSDIQKEVGVSFIVNGKLLIRTQPQCNLSIASDAAAAALNIQAQQLKQNFLGRCSAAASLNDIFANIDQVINDQGPNGGTAAVTNWVNNLYTEPDRQGMRRMWTILVNTDICPYFREQALDYFGVPQSYRDNPPNISSTDLNTTADAPFQLRGACTLPPTYVPGGDNDVATFALNGGLEFITKLAQPQNNLSGFIDMGEAELARQRTVSVQAAVNEAVSGGGFRSIYGSGTEGCKTLDPETGQCIEFAAVRQPPGAVEQINGIKFSAPVDWLVSTNGTTNKGVQDMVAVFSNHILNMANQPLPFRIQFGFEDKPSNYAPSPTPTPVPGDGSPNDPKCTGGNPACTCLKNDTTAQSTLTPLIASAMTAMMTSHPEFFNPPGSSVIAASVDHRTVLQALCDQFNQGGTKSCEPSPTISSQIVIIGGPITFSVDVITSDGALRTNGGIPILACESGVQD